MTTDSRNIAKVLGRDRRFHEITGRRHSDGPARRWLLFQQQPDTGESWWATFDDPRSALDYAADDALDGWDPISLVDLDTDERFVVHVVAPPIFGLQVYRNAER